MNAKTYLNQIRHADTLINRKNEELNRLREMLTSISADPSKEKVSSSKGQDTLGNTVAKIVDLQNEINADIDKLIDLKKEVIATIDSIGNTDQIDILYRRYIRFQKWEWIAIDMNYNLRWIYRLHGKALKKISEKLESGH